MFRLSLALSLAFTWATIAAAQKEKPVVTNEVPKEKKDFPPGWFPINLAEDDKWTWKQIRDDDEKEPKVRLYLPPGVKSVRGVFLSFQFHSADARHMGKLWDFAVVTIPWPISWDIGSGDQRSGRVKLGLPIGNTGYLLRYLELAAADTNHPELTTAPIVGWLHQDGAKFLANLYPRAPQRILAWSDGWPNQMKDVAEITPKVPFVFAWEVNGGDRKEREAAATAAGDTLKEKLTPPTGLVGRATMYNFPHGMYAKHGYFMSYLDRCVRARMPAEMPPIGQEVTLKPLNLKDGWAGDYNGVSEWAPIAPVSEAKGFIQPVWFPDEYAAWTWRAYHSAKPDLKIVSPVTEYHGGDRSDCGVGYTKFTPANTPVKIVAEVKGTYAKVEFRDGNKLLGTATAAPYEIDGIKFARGLHALIAVGITAEGKHVASHPAFLGVE